MSILQRRSGRFGGKFQLSGIGAVWRLSARHFLYFSANRYRGVIHSTAAQHLVFVSAFRHRRVWHYHPQSISAIDFDAIPVSCYPNLIQSNTTAQVQFSLREAAPIDIEILGIGGRQVSRIVQNRFYAKDTHLLPMDLQTLPLVSDVYFCRVSTPHGHGVCKIVMMR